MIHLFELGYQTIISTQFLFIAVLFSLSSKFYFLTILVPKGLRSARIHQPWLYLLGVIIGSMFGDLAWAIKLMRNIWFGHINYSVVTFFIRIAWAYLILQYQSLSLFIESLTEKKFKLRVRHKIFLVIGLSFSLYFFYLAFFDSSFVTEYDRELAKGTAAISFEITMMRYAALYLFNLLLIPSLYATLKKIRKENLPLILKKQLRIFIQFLICPYIIVEFLQAANFMFTSFAVYLYPVVSISTILLIYAIYYCIKRVMGLRFLNFSNHVQATHNLNFIDDFKNVLDQLSNSTSTKELNHVIQTFFKDTFNIAIRSSHFYIRSFNSSKELTNQISKIENAVELFLSTSDSELLEYLTKQRILIFDEIAFTNFYEEDRIKKEMLSFLETINADIFLPIYENQKIVAYVMVNRHARIHEFYSKVERDEMLVFASYLGNILNLMQHRNIESLVQQEKELRDEIFSNHQEINQYKESIRSFLRNSKQKEIGIIFYKQRRFIFGNQIAKEIIKININIADGHPLTQALKSIARQVEEYKSPQSCITKDTTGNKLVICGVTNLEQQNVILTVYYPEISDIIIRHIVTLKDPNKWDYLLYLETTQAGQSINQCIPGSGEHLLQFKINLLKLALSKKALLLESPDEDIQALVEVIHHISSRETLHCMTLTSQEKNNEMSFKLFGSPQAPAATSALFKKLDHNSTLFIKNIEFLDIYTQEQLAEYIMSGTYHIFRTEQRCSSSVRIIATTSENLKAYALDNKFSKKLLSALQKNCLTFPSLPALPESELYDLIDGLTENILKTQAFKNILELTEKEKNKLLQKRPESLHELRNKVVQALIEKSKKHHLYQDTQFDPSYSTTDPELIQAARLGKQALRDAKIMMLLWNKFKNQNQIATFLGVNRSSVNRRCKDYNII